MTCEEVAVDPAGEVLDADTIALITQLGASLSNQATKLAAENRRLRAVVETLQSGWKPLSRRENERLRAEVGDLTAELKDAKAVIDGLTTKIANDARRAHDIDLIADLCGGDRFVAAQIVDVLDVENIR